MLYLICFLISFSVTFITVPIVRLIALKLNILDIPYTDIKTHKFPVPYLGGISIVLGFFISLTLIRLFTDFPTGTLHSLRGIFLGGVVVFILGLIDDIKFKGLNFKVKFVFQIIAGIILIIYGIDIKFINPYWFGMFISLIWIVGITNAINIIDIMDGLASGVVLISLIGFFLIGLPEQKEIYVNFASISLAGACLGFIPYNLSEKYKIFMGDAGSLFLGFIISAVSLGTRYSELNQIGMLAPLIIVAVPVYDTLLVIYFRWKKGVSPFKGSKDHFALRLEKIGFSRKKILIYTYIVCILLSFIAFLITISNIYVSLFLYIVVFIFAVYIAYKLSLIKVD